MLIIHGIISPLNKLIPYYITNTASINVIYLHRTTHTKRRRAKLSRGIPNSNLELATIRVDLGYIIKNNNNLMRKLDNKDFAKREIYKLEVDIVALTMLCNNLEKTRIKNMIIEELQWT